MFRIFFFYSLSPQQFSLCPPEIFFQMHSYKTSLLLSANVSRECNSTAESTFNVNVSRELQLELYGKYSALLEEVDVFC